MAFVLVSSLHKNRNKSNYFYGVVVALLSLLSTMIQWYQLRKIPMNDTTRLSQTVLRQPLPKRLNLLF